MNDDRNLERAIVSTYEETAPSREPRGLLDDVLLTTSHTRQRPSWLALIKESPMRLSSSLAVGSPTVRVAAILVATLLITLMVAGAGVAGSRLLAADGAIVVDQNGGGDFTTITEAVAEAEDGDTILVKPGTYDESVTVTKDVTIRGDGDRDSIIVEVSEGLGPSFSVDPDPELATAFIFDGSAATLEHLTVRGDSSRILVSGGSPVLRDLVLDGLGRVCCTGTSYEPSGLLIYDESTATIEGNVIQEMAVDFVLGADPTVSGNDISGGSIWMQGEGVDPVIRENSMDGLGDIAIWGGASPTIEANTITNMPGGIEVQDTGWQIPDTGTNPVIRGNTISGATSAGISVDSEASATIVDNELDGNVTGLSVRGSGAVITGNVIREGRTGVNLSGGGSPILEENTIEGNEFGLMIGSGTTPTLTGNTICGNGKNLLLSGSAEMPDTTGNEICEDAPDSTE
jgi:F-box protein 11